MFVCLSLVGGRGRSNFCDVNCARRYCSEFVNGLVKVNSHNYHINESLADNILQE